jgi:hypothetical protein
MHTQRWNTDLFVSVLTSCLPDCQITISEPGGDHDTTEIVVGRNVVLTANEDGVQYMISGDVIYVFGMCTERYLDPSEIDDTDVDIVFACNNPQNGMVYASSNDYRLLADVIDALKTINITTVENGWGSYF